MKIDRLPIKQAIGALLIACATFVMCLMPVRGTQQHHAPYLRKQGTATQLIVDKLYRYR